jgi:2-amino-4-hydroxy-6-hydroxymethyldihydropteridine diphosphokinase
VAAINTYYLALGSNIEPRLEYLNQAVRELSGFGSILRKSSLYESLAWGKTDQAGFLNAVIHFQAELQPAELLQSLKQTERKLGRIQREHWGPREIDIDIIFCEGRTVKQAELVIPHPLYRERLFVLAPMAELNSEYRAENETKTIADYLELISDHSTVRKLTGTW